MTGYDSNVSEFSPDSLYIAYTQNSGLGFESSGKNIYIFEVKIRKERMILCDWFGCWSLGWLQKGDDLLLLIDQDAAESGIKRLVAYDPRTDLITYDTTFEEQSLSSFVTREWKENLFSYKNRTPRWRDVSLPLEPCQDLTGVCVSGENQPLFDPRLCTNWSAWMPDLPLDSTDALSYYYVEKVTAFAVSPDHRWLAVSSKSASASANIVQDVKSRAPRYLRVLFGGKAGLPYWSSDSRFVAFANEPRGGRPIVHLFDLEKRNNELVAQAMLPPSATVQNVIFGPDIEETFVEFRTKNKGITRVRMQPVNSNGKK